MSPCKYLLTLTILREENAVVAGNTNRYINGGNAPHQLYITLHSEDVCYRLKFKQ